MSDLAAQIERHDSGMVRLEANLQQLRAQFEAASVDVEKIRFSPKVVMAIVLTVVTSVAGQYASTAGIRTTQADILARMDKQQAVDVEKSKSEEKQVVEVTKQFESIAKAMTEIVKEQRMQQLKIEEINLGIVKQGARK